MNSQGNYRKFCCERDPEGTCENGNTPGIHSEPRCKTPLDFQGIYYCQRLTDGKLPGSSSPLLFVNFHELERPLKPGGHPVAEQKMVRIPMVFQVFRMFFFHLNLRFFAEKTRQLPRWWCTFQRWNAIQRHDKSYRTGMAGMAERRWMIVIVIDYKTMYIIIGARNKFWMFFFGGFCTSAFMVTLCVWAHGCFLLKLGLWSSHFGYFLQWSFPSFVSCTFNLAPWIFHSWKFFAALSHGNWKEPKEPRPPQCNGGSKK